MTAPGSSRKQKGDNGEQLAANLLRDKGFELIERNYTIGGGELDIIARCQGVLVFVEVKSKDGLEFGHPVYAVTPAKARQVKRLAAMYLAEQGILAADCRFDVVTVYWDENKSPVVEHFENALFSL